MLLALLANADEVHRYEKSVILTFAGSRSVLSTGASGGIRRDLKSVFNHDCTQGAGMSSSLKAPTMEEHIRVHASDLGLDPDRTIGLATAAQMDNVAIETRSYKDITVSAIVTGGVEVNGGRAGDPASWDELSKESLGSFRPGTINILLHVSVNLTDGALARCLVTATEAKTAALQELAAPSRYSSGLATGSGTDGVIVIANTESPITLENAGKHVKLGELIGTSVKAAVKRALFLQTGLGPESQHFADRRMERYGVSRAAIWEAFTALAPEVSRPAYESFAPAALASSEATIAASLTAHILDELSWGLIGRKEAASAYALAVAGLGETPAESELADIPAAFRGALARLLLAKARQSGISGAPGPQDA